MSVILLFENVWGDALADLQHQHQVIRSSYAQLPSTLESGNVGLGDIEAIVVRNKTQVNAALLDQLPALKIVARAGVGLDNIDVAACDERGVVVMSPRGANAVSVAEHAVTLALAIAKRLLPKDAAVRENNWDRSSVTELAGGVWGLLGAGSTGLATAALARGIGMTVIAHDPYADPSVLAANDIGTVSQADLAARSDVMSIHLPATPDTEGMLDEAFFAAVKQGLIVVNVGRGEVIDETALTAAIKAGTVRGAGLDVRVQEPPQPGPLDKLTDVIYSPHVAGITDKSQRRIVEAMASDIGRVLDNQPANHAVGTHQKAQL